MTETDETEARLEQRIVSDDEAHMRLDRFLRRHHPGLTQGVIQRLCRTGQVRVAGKRVEASTRLEPGQAVRIPPTPDANAPTRHTIDLNAHEAADLAKRVLYRDDDVLVLDKPAGLATQGGKGIARHLDGMLEALQFGAAERPKLVHRLDRGTSGVLILARNSFAASALAAAFRGRDAAKIYWALVVGLPIPLEGRIDLPLARIGGAGARTKPAARNDEQAAAAITDYRTLDHAGRKFAWLELRPLTGRTHQLRAHCAALETPILGDAPYAGARAYAEGFEKQMHLHARRLSIAHPRGGVLEIEAEAPPHIRNALTSLGFTIPRAAPPVLHRRS